MATDTRAPHERMAREMTLAELCEAIADGRLSYSVSDDGQYEIRAGDVRRLGRGHSQVSFDPLAAGAAKDLASPVS
ncbi:MAG TPA: hypothetical protein VFU88_08530 [Ktedonobacterales bacterium]|nr:hypothetical protein [Ktedonobacterales bacterium]